MSAITWHRPEYKGREDELVGLSEVAALAGVSRAAVSNWRRRHDFPQPAMTAGQTIWVVRAEAETWLSSRTTHTMPDRTNLRAVLEAREARQTAALAKTRKQLRQLTQNH
jgi:predicted DNA-binding transcriptional regulator AlpA